MKKALLAVCISVVMLTSCDIRNSKQNEQSSQDVVSARMDVKTNVRLIDSTFNFGKIKEGETVAFSYRFENTGEYPLVIASASASCGCTIPEKPEQPIPPGESAFIKVVFNSRGTGGIIHKEVHVRSNAQPDFPTLSLNGEVIAN